MSDLTHLDAKGDLHMVDVGDKAITARSATAEAVVRLPQACREVLAAGGDTRKGNVLQCARLAGIMAAKQTSTLIPLCHQLPLDQVAVEFDLHDDQLLITVTARCTARTGVEMEALTAASVAALTVYDMLKGISHDLVIDGIQLRHKEGGRSGTIDRSAAR